MSSLRLSPQRVAHLVALALAAAPPTAAAAATGQAAAAGGDAPRPNIVLVIGDDMSWHDSEPYGSTDVPTPSIARLAREGMLFERAFQATAMCAVTRHQLYTGLDPIRSGAYPQHSWTRPEVESLFGYFRAIGYRVGITGKTHVGPPEVFPWETIGESAPSVGEGGGDTGVPPVDMKAAEAFMARDAAQPFLLVIASHHPHAPWTEGDPSRFDPTKIHLPPYLADTPFLRGLLVRYYAEITALDAELGELLAILDRHRLADSTMVLFTSEQGNAVPFAKWTLYDAGIRTELIVRWPGRVAAGSRTGAMVTYADVVPTLLEAAGAAVPEGLDGRSFLGVLRGEIDRHRDVVFGIHTNFGIIGGEPYPIRSARDQRYQLIRNLAPDRDYRNVLNNTRQGRRMIDDWTAAGAAGNDWARARVAAYDRRPGVELYDLDTDPWELSNRADDPALAAVRQRLERELDAWMQQQGDTGMAAELDAFRHINPAVLRWINENYPDAARNPDGSRVRP